MDIGGQRLTPSVTVAIMPILLLSSRAYTDFATELSAVGGEELRFVVSDADPRPSAGQLASLDIALMSLDVFGKSTKSQPTPELLLFSEQLRAAAQLQWLHVPTAGVDRPIFQEMLKRGVRISTSSGANAAAVAHTALMGVLLLARGGLKWMHAQAQHRWAPLRDADAPADLEGQVAVVVGFGPIGRRIALSLEALGLQVHKLRHTPQPSDAALGVHAYEALPQLACQAQWLVIACPLTQATRHLVDAKVLNAMPRGSFIVNVGRGGVVDEQALLATLASGQIAGAHLDVFEQEPLPADSPFWDLPNVLVSPHNAGSSQQYGPRCVQLFIDNLGRWVRGESLQQEVRHEPSLTP